MLKALAEGKEIPVAPSLEEGLELLQFKSNITNPTASFGS